MVRAKHVSECHPGTVSVAHKVTRLLLLLILLASRHANAQAGTPSPLVMLTLNAGTESENYLRYLQSLGDAPLTQWSIRPFGPREVDDLTSRRLETYSLPMRARTVHDKRGLHWQLVPAVADAWYNTRFPFGGNDGAVWRGRGLTTAVQGGASLRFGVLSINLEPIVFRAENQSFPLMPNGETGVLVYADPIRPRDIDRPQRFGSRAYARLDPGQSTIRVDLFGVALGLSTANQWWGPMSEWPYLLGTNAAGFPHVFAGSSTAWNIGVGRIHGRVIYGRLEQSAYTDITGRAASRFTGGIVGSFMPRGLDGLEIGAARLFETPWPANGISWPQLRKPFEAFLKANVAGDSGTTYNSSIDNQLASFFVRWTFPSSGLEVYSEYGREDHSWDTNDLLEEPDHSATLGLGVRKAWRRDDHELSAFRAELFDIDPSTLGRHRGEGSIYIHTATRQGHTERGQVLGAGFAAINGMGAMMAYERYGSDQQKLLVSLSRMVVRERMPTPTLPASLDVQYALAAERTRRVGPIGLTSGLTLVYELNRYFQSDGTNLELHTRVAW